jgi:hypothetical protein
MTILPLKLAKEVLRADKVVVEDASRRVEELGDERIADGISDARPSLRPATMLLLRKTGSCCETTG